MHLEDSRYPWCVPQPHTPHTSHLNLVLLPSFLLQLPTDLTTCSFSLKRARNSAVSSFFQTAPSEMTHRGRQLYQGSQGGEGQWWLPRSSGVRMKEAGEGSVPLILTSWRWSSSLSQAFLIWKVAVMFPGQSSEKGTVGIDWSGLSAALSIWTSSVPYL